MSTFPFLQYQLSAAKAELSTNAFKRFVAQVEWMKDLLAQRRYTEIIEHANLQGFTFDSKSESDSDHDDDDSTEAEQRDDHFDGSETDDAVNVE